MIFKTKRIILKKGIKIKSWKILFYDKVDNQRIGYEHLVYYENRYYSIITGSVLSVENIYNAIYSIKRLKLKKQIGEFSYRGKAILIWKGLLKEWELVGSGNC